MTPSPSLHPICRWAEAGSLVDDGSGSFTNWYHPGEPGGGEWENCMQLRASDGKWRDASCTSSHVPAVCSKPIASAAAETIVTTTSMPAPGKIQSLRLHTSLHGNWYENVILFISIILIICTCGGMSTEQGLCILKPSICKNSAQNVAQNVGYHNF